jgi:hypothetical protein
MSTGDIILTFDDKGDFAATARAQAWLVARGFSYGALSAPDEPRAVLWGYPRTVAKWRSLSDAHRAALDGAITGDPKAGPVIVTIYARAPAAARMAVQRARAA